MNKTLRQNQSTRNSIFALRIIFALDAIDEELKFTIAEEKCIYYESLTNFRKDNISYIPNIKSTSISFILTYDCNLIAFLESKLAH